MSKRTKTGLIISSLAVLVALPAAAQELHHSNHNMSDHTMSGMARDRTAHMVEALATVMAVVPDENQIGLSHGAIPEVSWPAATMKFPVPGGIDVTAFSPGDRVQFTLHRAQNGSLPLVELCPANGMVVQAGLCAKSGMMDHGAMGHSQMDISRVTTTGTVLRVDAAARALRIKHDPIPSIGWPVMTMQFVAASNVDLAGLSEGEVVSFDFNPNADDSYIILAIRPANQTQTQPGSAVGERSGHDGH